MIATSEKKIKLTKRTVDSAQPNTEVRFSIWDKDLKGFHIRIYPTGRKVYYFQYRNKYRATRKINIGLLGNISTEEARKTAQQLALGVSNGIDPAAQIQAKMFLPNMKELCHEYIELHAKVNKRTGSKNNDLGMIKNTILPLLGRKKLEEISPHDLKKLHRDLRETPYKANRVCALLSKMFNLAIEWNWISTNPAKFVNKYQEHKRTRWLDEKELQKLWLVLDDYPNRTVSVAVKMLLLTGARKTEVLSARWDQFDFQRGTWTKPSHMTKQNREEHLPLSSVTLDLLKSWKKENATGFLFPGKNEDQPLKDVKRPWMTIRTMAELEDVRIHDLRHTHASHLVSSGLSLSIVGKLLGHTQPSTTQRYAHLADEPLREAAELFGRKVKRNPHLVPPNGKV